MCSTLSTAQRSAAQHAGRTRISSSTSSPASSCCAASQAARTELYTMGCAGRPLQEGRRAACEAAIMPAGAVMAGSHCSWGSSSLGMHKLSSSQFRHAPTIGKCQAAVQESRLHAVTARTPKRKCTHLASIWSLSSSARCQSARRAQAMMAAE